MASPFYLFRKYQRAFIAIAAVVAMFIFVVADPLMTWLQSSAGGGPQQNGNTVVATWDGGEINLMELERLTQRRYKISEFLRNLIGRAARTIEEEGGTALPPNLPDFILPNTDQQAVQQGCVTTQVFAHLAKDSGITVSDAFINHYLKEWGLGKAGDAEIAALLTQFRLSDKALFAGMRELLMTHFYTSGYALATSGVMPEEQWQDWKRINEQIIVEAASLPVDSFIAAVPDPSEAELKGFYEQYKERASDSLDALMGVVLPSPTPGFRIPRQVKIQYLIGNVDDWSQKLLDTVTDEEIADYYERNKRTQFVRAPNSIAPRRTTSAEGLFDDEPATSDEAGSEETTSEESVPEEEATSEEGTATGENASEEPMSEESESEEGVNEESATSESPTEESSPTEDTAPEEEKPAESTEEPAAEDTGRSQRISPFRLAALQTESEESLSEDSSEGGSDTTESDSEESDVEASDSGDLDEDVSDSEFDEEPVDFEPLKNVKEQIRRSLAVDKAVVELQKIVDQASANLEAAYTPYGYEVVSARTEQKEIPAPPAKLADFKAIATETGLISEETVLRSQRQLAETYVGRAVDVKTRSQLVHQAMFGDIQLYEPFRAVDLAGNSYIVSKTEDIPSRVPEFKEVRDDVLAAWKKAEAAKLAIAKAEELAKAAQESGDALSVAASAQKYDVVQTDPFSYWTFGGATQADLQRGPRLGQAPPLESVGIDFMEKAFELEADQKVAVMNHDQSVAYVIQLDRRERTEEELKKQFLSDSVNGWFGGRVMNYVRFQMAQQQLEAKLTDEIGLDTERLREFFARSSQ